MVKETSFFVQNLVAADSNIEAIRVSSPYCVCVCVDRRVCIPYDCNVNVPGSPYHLPLAKQLQILIHIKKQSQLATQKQVKLHFACLLSQRGEGVDSKLACLRLSGLTFIAS